MNSNLARVEWDFSSVPDREMDACFTWESAREWSETIPKLRMIEALPADSIYKNERSEWGSFSGLLPAEMLVGKIDLLGSPWLLLPKSVRAECVSFESQPFEETELNSLDMLEAFKGQSGEGKNVLCFQIDWDASDSRIMEEFSEWLTKTRVKPAVERRGSSARDHLRMLGAMRLLHHYPLEEAVTLTTRLLGKPLYGQRPSWERARRGAVEAIFEALLYDEGEVEEELLLDELASYQRYKRAKAMM